MILAPPIRLACERDAVSIAQLSRDAIEQGLGWSWTPRRVRASVLDRATNVAVAHHGSELVGFGIMKYGDEEAHLLLLAVRFARRRRGVGSALLAWLEASARVAGLEAVRLELRQRNGGALAFYERHGFAESGRLAGYYQGVEDAVQMSKPLRTAPAGSSDPAMPQR